MITLISVSYYIRVPFYGLIKQNWFHVYLCPIAFFLLSWNILSSCDFFPLRIWTTFPRVFVGPFSCINCELRQNMRAKTRQAGCGQWPIMLYYSEALQLFHFAVSAPRKLDRRGVTSRKKVSDARSHLEHDIIPSHRVDIHRYKRRITLTLA